MSWHVDAALVQRYRAGELDQARAGSLEAHVVACEPCRGLIAAATDRARHEAVWERVQDVADRPRPLAFERLLARLGVASHVARLVAATPALTLSWFSAVAVALAWALLAANNGQRGVIVFLVLAPLIPLAGVAFAFGPGVDPVYDVSVASPMRGARLLLLRATAVFTTSTVLTAAASIGLPGIGWKAAAWLLPALGVTTTALALATWLEPRFASVVVALGWISVVVVSAAARTGGVLDRFGIFEAQGQLSLALVTLCSAGLLAARLGTFDTGRNA